VENGKNREAIFTIFRHLSGASRRSNGVIELTLNQVALWQIEMALPSVAISI